METAKGKTREDVVNRLADRIDSFEKYSQPHSHLMAELASQLARRFGLASLDIEAIFEAAMLHDIGLYTMAPAYHALPRPLSFEARLDLWRHPVIGEQQMAKRDAMRHAQLLVRWHHEWWNGSGYPDMLAFEDIPIGARILRAVELYSSLLCDRPYRASLDEQQALETLTSAAGTECDPYVVKALLALLDELRQVRASEQTTTDRGTSPDPVVLERRPSTVEPTVIPTSTGAGNDLWEAHPVKDDRMNSESESTPKPWGDGLEAFVPTTSTAAQQPTQLPSNGSGFSDTRLSAPEAADQFAPRVSMAETLLAQATSTDFAERDLPRWYHWKATRYNKKTLLGFQASVLRQLDFRSIAIPFWDEARLDLYLKAWGKIILANDPREWAGVVARAHVEGNQPLNEDTISRILHDVYVPGARLLNPDLRRWFSETDSWWMDNLRRNIDALDDEVGRCLALTLGLQTGDYALSFDEETIDLRRPLTTVFWRLAGRGFAGAVGQPHNRAFNQPAEEFIKKVRADVLYLRSPAAHTDRGGAEARSDWRTAWIKGAAANESTSTRHPTRAQSKQSYLTSLDRLLRTATTFRLWAVEYQEPGAATAQDIIELIKEYRPVKATYSKDVTEVAGGLRSYIIVGETSHSR